MTRMTVLEAQHLTRRRLLELRAMARFMETDRFEQALLAATEDHLKKLEPILKSDSTANLRAWAKAALQKSIHDLNIRELMALARDKMIPKYSRLNRDQLIRKLEQNGNATSVG